jgi:phage baseplate assembly protein W
MADEIALTIPFSVDKFGNLSVTADERVIWSNKVRMAIGTTINERVMRPEYGTSIAIALFDTGSFMENTVKSEIERTFHDSLPLLTLTDISLDFTSLSNTLTVKVVYELPNKKEATTEVGIVVVSTNNSPYEELS